VIGVVITALDRSRFDFRAVRLKPLLDQPDFLELVKNTATVASETARAEAPSIEGLVCLLDRDDQESDFVELHKLCCGASGGDRASTMVNPMICLLPGAAEYRHQPEDLAERLSLKTLPELAWPAGTTAFEWIEWPAGLLDLQTAFSRLRASLWNRICGAGDTPSEAQKFRDLWSDGSRPRLFRSDFTQRPLTPETAQVLKAWSEFLVQIAPPIAAPLST
jgi:hypothetical protein